MASKSWKDVAAILAERVEHYAYSCPVGRGEPGVSAPSQELIHRLPEQHASECPFCADTAAYNEYLKKVASMKGSQK